jgi:phospholipase A1
MPAVRGHFCLEIPMKKLLIAALFLPLCALADDTPPPAPDQSIPADPAAVTQPAAALPTIPLPEKTVEKNRTLYEREFENFYQSPEDFSITNVSSGLSTHKPMYLLPYTYSSTYSGRHAEVVFQISAKQKLFGSNFFVGYTQQSFWQLYNRKESSPFRETVYNPEVFYRWIGEGDWLKNLGADGGFEHQSNGKNLPDSRSWNRFYVAPFLAYGKTLIYLKAWYRLPEKAKTGPTDSEGDDNPDIERYLGHGELQIQQQLFTNHLAHLKLRANTNTGKGAIAFNYSIPSKNGATYYSLNFFSGYGESLIDYNQRITRIGFGVMLAR